MKPEVVPPWLGELYQGARLDQRVRFASDASSADTSCSEPDTTAPNAAGSVPAKEPDSVTGADVVAVSAFVRSFTESGLREISDTGEAMCERCGLRVAETTDALQPVCEVCFLRAQL